MSKYLTDFLLEIKEDADDSELKDESNFYLFDWSTPESKEEMLDIAMDYDLEQNQIAIIESSSGAILIEQIEGAKDSITYDSIEMLEDKWNEILEETKSEDN